MVWMKKKRSPASRCVTVCAASFRSRNRWAGVLTDVLRTELVGRTLEVTREIFDGLEVDAGCSLGVITTLEFLEHHFCEGGS